MNISTNELTEAKDSIYSIIRFDGESGTTTLDIEDTLSQDTNDDGENVWVVDDAYTRTEYADFTAAFIAFVDCVEDTVLALLDAAE